MARRILAALAAGLIFGIGLTFSGMLDPEKVLGFLDFVGDWDPSLAFVMAGSIPVAWVGFAVVRRLGRPLLAEATLPAARFIDRKLIGGAILFGVGWGLAGYCPGPALASLGFLRWQTGLFVMAMLTAMIGLDFRNRESTQDHCTKSIPDVDSTLGVPDDAC